MGEYSRSCIDMPTDEILISAFCEGGRLASRRGGRAEPADRGADIRHLRRPGEHGAGQRNSRFRLRQEASGLMRRSAETPQAGAVVLVDDGQQAAVRAQRKPRALVLSPPTPAASTLPVLLNATLTPIGSAPPSACL